MFLNQGERWGLALHLALAFCTPAMLLALYYQVGAPMIAVWVLAPVVAYCLALYDDDPFPDEPCSRSGNAPWGYWFEFPSLPGRRLFTPDRGLAESIRARSPTALQGGHELHVVPPADPRPDRHVHIGARSLLWTGVGTVAGALWCALLITALAAIGPSAWRVAETPMDLMSAAGEVGSLGAFMLGAATLGATLVLVPYAVFFGVVFGAVFLAWNGLWRPAQRSAVVTPTRLRGGTSRIDLDDATLEARLDHTSFDARLTVEGRHGRLVLHGRHPQLHALARWIARRPVSDDDERRRMLGSLRDLRRSAAH